MVWENIEEIKKTYYIISPQLSIYFRLQLILLE